MRRYFSCGQKGLLFRDRKGESQYFEVPVLIRQFDFLSLINPFQKTVDDCRRDIVEKGVQLFPLHFLVGGKMNQGECLARGPPQGGAGFHPSDPIGNRKGFHGFEAAAEFYRG